jgi:hypothetical protein
LGATPLVEAVTASAPSREKIALLLDAGANLHVRFDWKGHRDLNVLMAAAMNASPQVVQLLLDWGAYKYAKSGDGLTPYVRAALADRPDNAELLR